MSHAKRAEVPARFPQHVTLRLRADVPSIAREWLMKKVLRPAIQRAQKESFRVAEFNVLANHLHLVIEADGADALSRGVQGLAIRIARQANSALKHAGKVFAHRFHARALKTPREVRNALRYVLLNRKHHASEKRFFKGWIDPFSSGVWFRGWEQPIRMNIATRDLVREPPPTAPPQTWLLRVGWRRAGPLSYDDRPA